MVAAQRIRHFAFLLLLFAAYVTLAKVGLSFAVINPSASAFWAPAGLALAAVLLGGPPLWPAIFLGAFVINLLTTGSVLTSLAIAIGNTLEALVGAFLLVRFVGGRATFRRVGGFLRFSFLASVAPIISATIGPTALSAAGYAAWKDYGAIWLTWWLGDMSGIVLVTPLLVLLAEARATRWRIRRYVEAACLFVGLAVSAYLVFDRQLFGPNDLPLEFFTLPFLIWAAFRFGPRETAGAIVLLAAVAAWGTHQGAGPFGVLGGSGALLLQASTVTAAITGMCTALLVVDRRQSEAERVRALAAEQAARREAEAANAAKDRFMAMLGHELRNPLAAIVTGVHLMERAPSGRPERSRAADIVRRQVAHLTRLVDDLMDLGRITADKLTLERNSVNLAEIVTTALTTVRAADREFAVSVDVACEPVWVDGDTTRLTQIAMNLITNALKFTPPGGRVSVSTSRAGHLAILTIADTGVGISESLLPRVFDLFRQGDAGPDPGHHGLGIGLTLVKSLVELHGGTVSAASAGRNRGSTFMVRLPALVSPDVRARGPADTLLLPAAAGLRRRVLIAEDEADLRRILRAALEAAGHEVFEAANGPDAVHAVERHKPDAAIVDIGLPQFDGHEVARQVRRLPTGETLLLVALTGYGHPHGREQALAAGFNLHLLKPIDPGRLNEILVAQDPVRSS